MWDKCPTQYGLFTADRTLECCDLGFAATWSRIVDADATVKNVLIEAIEVYLIGDVPMAVDIADV